MAVNHPQNDIPVFAIVETVIKPLNGKGIFEYLMSGLKCDAVIGEVRGGLDVVPHELFIFHDTAAQP